MKSAASLIAVSAALALLASGGAYAREAQGKSAVSGRAALGPAGDYPMVLGEPFVVDGVTYTPADTLNYDSVGFAHVGADGDGVAGEHRTLPLPSYVEVTSLETGRTILVRLTRRGPVAGGDLVALSPAAWAQLGTPPDARLPVRVRRVNPPEAERALLRAGTQAPVRMDTPPGLLGALRRKLGIAPVTVSVPAAKPEVPQVLNQPVPPPKQTVKPVAEAKAVVKAATKPAVKPALPKAAAAKPEVKAPVAATPEKPPVSQAVPKPVGKADVTQKVQTAARYVQVGAYSSKDRAEKVAGAVGGSVSSAGKLWRVRIGPNKDRAETDAALAKARAAGYADAKVVTAP